MRKQIVENAAYEVATQIRAVEDSIDAALVELADLQSKMVHARTATGVGFATSHAAFEQLAAATSGLVAARGGVASCHTALVETKRFIPGLRTTSFGEGDECPPAAVAAGLRVVA
jgi:dGTP triphosphohydrolase